MKGSAQYQANPVVSFRDEGTEGAVLFNPDTDKCVILNAVGASIWRFLAQPRTLDEMISMLAERFSGVDAVKVREDLERFLGGFGEGFIDEIS